MDQNNNKRKLEIKENPNTGVYIKDCQIKIAQSELDLEKVLKDGNKNKSMGETLMNRDSSRSHCIFTIYVETSEVLKVILLTFSNIFRMDSKRLKWVN